MDQPQDATELTIGNLILNVLSLVVAGHLLASPNYGLYVPSFREW